MNCLLTIKFTLLAAFFNFERMLLGTISLFLFLAIFSGSKPNFRVPLPFQESKMCEAVTCKDFVPVCLSCDGRTSVRNYSRYFLNI